MKDYLRGISLSFMSFIELTRLTAIALAEGIQSAEFSSVEVVKAHIEQIERVNPAANAVVVRRYEAALREAEGVDAARIGGAPLPKLAGVPITVKESIDLAGTPSSYGIPWRSKELASSDERHVARLRAEGAIPIAKTNVSQLLLSLEASNPVYGRTNNPFDCERTSGGSSGGEAAIVALEGSPLGVGTDIGGSLRVPATFCGVATLRPTAGRHNHCGRYSVPQGQQAIRSQLGFLARSVDDIEYGMRIIAEPHSQYSTVPFLRRSSEVDLSQLRVGWSEYDGLLPASPPVRRAVREVAAALAGGGAQVVEWAIPDPETALGLFVSIISADGLRFVKDQLRGDPVDPLLRRWVWLAGRSRVTLSIVEEVAATMGDRYLSLVAHHLGRMTTRQYWEALTALEDYRSRFAVAADRTDIGPLDVLVCPVAPTAAFRHNTTLDVGSGGVYSLVASVVGWPAGSIPWTRVHHSEESDREATTDRALRALKQSEQGSIGLPVGVQVIARPWHEHVALAVMRYLEDHPLRSVA